MSSPPPSPQGTFRAGLRLAWPVGLVVLGAMVLATAWHRWPVSLLFAVAAAVPMLLLRGALRLGISRWASSSLLVLLVVMGAYVLTARADLTLESTVSDVIPRLLTSPQPYQVRADLIVGPLLLTCFVSLLVGLRADGRTRVEPLVGAAVLYVAGALLTAGAADPWGLVAVLLLVVALLGWIFLDEHSEPVRQRFSVAAPVTVLGVGVLAAVATLPLQRSFEPRDLVDPPIYEVSATNPLSQLGAWAANPDTELLRVRGDEVPLRLVVLDEYDGLQWTSSTRYTALDAEGRVELPAGDYRSDATVQVEFAGLGGSWLPSPGTPRAVGDPDALVDLDTGTLYDPEAAEGLNYEISGSYDSPPEDVLEGARAPESGLDRYLELPPLPDGLVAYGTRVAAGAATPYERALRIETQLRRDYVFDPSAISGSALWRIENFLLGDDGKPGDMAGTSEQFATAFAVVARFNGLPTRVVVGFRPGEEQDDGTRLVRGEDALAWAEIYFDDLGWVAFSPTPKDDTFEHRPPVEAETPDLPDEAQTGSPSAVPTTPEPSSTSGDDADDAAAALAPDDRQPPWTPYAVGAGAVVLLVGGLAGLRAWRRWRHRRQGARGAWAEVLDALRLAGLRPPAHESAEQVALEADRRFGTTATTQVATRAEHAAFGPDEASSTPADPALRGAVRAVRRHAVRAVPRWRRWWWHLDPRVLIR